MNSGVIGQPAQQWDCHLGVDGCGAGLAQRCNRPAGTAVGLPGNGNSVVGYCAGRRSGADLFHHHSPVNGRGLHPILVAVASSPHKSTQSSPYNDIVHHLKIVRHRPPS
mmetsp:Transcript_42094/g.76973  ORF Transcript_42094/g.76973 Transcript_42094/m.76973 type:complete len:109 (+) Transcript_42094:201-527(+)